MMMTIVPSPMYMAALLGKGCQEPYPSDGG